MAEECRTLHRSLSPIGALPPGSGPSSTTTHWRAWAARYQIVDADTLPADSGGLLLTGGVDVNPRLYGEKRGTKTDLPNKERDEHEMALLRQALERDIPVLCICRGHELLNVALGGSLAQHIEGDGHRWHDDGTSGWHEITVIGDSRLAGVYGNGAVIRVNSRHHQGVTEDRLAAGLRPVANSTDGFVEAMESEKHSWVMGVQWHPERPEMQPDSLAVFHAFVTACR